MVAGKFAGFPAIEFLIFFKFYLLFIYFFIIYIYIFFLSFPGRYIYGVSWASIMIFLRIPSSCGMINGLAIANHHLMRL